LVGLLTHRFLGLSLEDLEFLLQLVDTVLQLRLQSLLLFRLQVKLQQSKWSTHTPYGITQCYLPLGRDDILAFIPAKPAFYCCDFSSKKLVRSSPFCGISGAVQKSLTKELFTRDCTG